MREINLATFNDTAAYNGVFSSRTGIEPTNTIVDIENISPEQIVTFNPELKTFLAAIKTKYPHLSFGISEQTVGLNNLHKAYVYMPEHCYTLGMVGYGDFRAGNHTDRKEEYAMWSPYIRNARVKSGSGQWRSSSSNMKTAVKNVGYYIRPHTSVSYLLIAGKTMVDMYTTTINGARHQVQYAMKKVTNEPATFWTDLLNIHKAQKAELQRPPKLSTILSNLLDDYTNQVGETQELLDKTTVNMLQVRTTVDGFEVNKLKLNDRVTLNPSSAYGNVELGAATTYTPETLPEQIGNKLSTLAMVHATTNEEDIDFILGVGFVDVKGHLYYIVDI
tara:strand:+ start:3092 stop:4090 length:999 start_codon:yes stop_codon:yes gene_type:complete